MELRFTVGGRIARPVDEVFEAVVAPDALSAYFTTGGAVGRIEPGATVTWDFHDYPGAFPVRVIGVVENERIMLEWGGHGSARTTVTMLFAALDDGRTHVRIEEHGWPDTPEGLKASYGNCEGWTGMLCAMKMWLEAGVRLREGFYR